MVGDPVKYHVDFARGLTESLASSNGARIARVDLDMWPGGRRSTGSDYDPLWHETIDDSHDD